MEVLLFMIIGIIIGLVCFPTKWKKWNERIQVISTAVLIFTMGVVLGSRPNFIKDFIYLGWDSLMLAIIPIIFSILFVYILTKHFFGSK